MEKVYCAWCKEDTEYDQGRMIWSSTIDESQGHRYCMETYDEHLKKKMVKEDEYTPPECPTCEIPLLLSREIVKEESVSISETGESLPSYFPEYLYRYGGRTTERLYCKRCNSYYEAEKFMTSIGFIYLTKEEAKVKKNRYQIIEN